MKEALASTALLLVFAPFLALANPPIARQASDPARCESVELYFYEGMPAEGYFDFANWTTRERQFGYLGFEREHTLLISPGALELFVQIYDAVETQLVDWEYLPGCSRAAIYLKEVGGQPVLRVIAFPPDGA